MVVVPETKKTRPEPNPTESGVAITDPVREKNMGSSCTSRQRTKQSTIVEEDDA